MGLGNEYESITETDTESDIKNQLKDGILKLLAATTKSVDLDEGALVEFSRLIFLLFEELVTVCAPLTSKDVEDYVSRAFPPEIYKACTEKGQAVYNKMQKKRGTISRRTADVRLKFPVESIYNLARKEWCPRGVDIKYNLIVYILAMLEYISTVMLERASALVTELTKNHGTTAKKPVMMLKHINIARNYHEVLRKLFEEERRGNTVKPALRIEPAQTYEEAVRRFMSDQSNYIKELQIVVNKLMPIFAKKESGLSGDMVDLLFGNVKDILLFEIIFQNDLEEAKEMIRQDSSFLVGVVFRDKALAEEYDVYVYYANNYKAAVKRFKELLEDQDFAEYLESQSECLGFCDPVIEGIIPRLMEVILKEPLYHILHIFQTVEDLLGFMSKDDFKEDRINELEYLKQTIVDFSRISGIIEQVEQEYLTNARDSIPHLTPRKAGILRLHKAYEKIENLSDNFQTFSQICTEHILNGNLLTVSDKKEQKLKHCYLFDGMLLVCARDVNAKATNVRTIFKEKYLLRELTQLKDHGPDSSTFDVLFKDAEIKFQAKNVRDKDEWVAAFLVLAARKVLYENVEQEETTELDYYAILLNTYRFTEPDTDSNIRFMENKTKQAPAIPTIAAGTLVKLVERVTFHKYTDLVLVKQFLTTFRFFAKPRDILDLLIERYNIPLPGDLLDNTDIEKIEKFKRLQKEYIKPVQLRVINVMRHWIDYHFDDFEKETQLVSIMMGFFDKCKQNQSTMKKWINPLERTIRRKEEHQQRRRGDSVVGATEPIAWHLTREKEEYSLFTLHPLEIARQATLIENEFYRSVTPQELLGSQQEKQGGNMAKMINFSERFVFWIRQSIVETQNLEERIYVATRVFELMEYMHTMNNFTGVFEVNSALKSAEVYRLDHTVKKLLKEKEELLKTVGDWPAMNFKSYKQLLINCNPPCIPFIGIYKTKILHTQDGNKDVKDDMINLSKFRKIADIISEIKLYQNERYQFVAEKSIQDFLRNLDPFRDRTSDQLQTDLYNLSLDLEPREGPPKFYPRSNMENLATVPPKVKRSGSIILGNRGKSETRRTRESSLSDASEGGLRTPGSKTTISPGSTRSPKEFFGDQWKTKFGQSGRSVASDHESPDNSPLLAPSTSETSDDCTEPSPRPVTRTETDDSPKPPLPPKQPKAPAPPARTFGRSQSVREKPSPTPSPSDDGEYLENIFQKPPLTPPKPPAATPPSTPPKIPPHPPMPKRTVSNVSGLTSIIETKERDSSGTSGESLSDIQYNSRHIHIDDKNPPHGMIKAYPTRDPIQPVRQKKNRPPPLPSVSPSSPLPPPIPLKTRPSSSSERAVPERKPPPLPPKTRAAPPEPPPPKTRAAPPEPPRPPLPPRRTSTSK